MIHRGHVQLVVEGESERLFVRQCVAPHLAPHGLTVSAISLDGVTGYGRPRSAVKAALGMRGVTAVSSLIDYYALPDDFPGAAQRAQTARAHVEQIEAAWAADIADRRFVPHVVLHELEAWVFAAPARLAARHFEDDDALLAGVAAIATAHATPEEIDDGAATAPSKRLAALFASRGRRYVKTVHGVGALAALGMAAILEACPHARAWLARLVAAATAE